MMFHLTPRSGSALAAAAILGAVLFVLPAAVDAQTAPPPPPPMAAAPQANPVEARIASLHTRLKITADEETQWQAVADAMRDSAKATSGLIQDRAAKTATMSAMDDLRSYQAIAEAHAAGVKKLADAFGILYAAMPDAQKKTADRVFRYRPRAAAPKTKG
jgi:protein CpxP